MTMNMLITNINSTVWNGKIYWIYSL